MAIHSFLKAEKGDPDWQFSPDDYFGKQFKIIDATIDLEENHIDTVVLRQNPTEKELLAKHLTVNLQRGSGLDLIILNDVDPTLQQVFLYDIHLKADAKINIGIFAKGGKFNKHILQVFMEDGAIFSAYGLSSNTTGGDTEIVTKVIHRGVESESNQLFLGVAGENSQVVFQGITIVEEDAVGAKTHVDNSNLITGSKGRCYSKPETYINADYVIQTQGSNTDTISLEKISYLQSRGLTEQEAKNMILSGFRSLVIDIVPQDNIQEEIKEMYAN